MSKPATLRYPLTKLRFYVASLLLALPLQLSAADKEPTGPTFEFMQETLPNPILDYRPGLMRAYWGAWWWMDVNTDHQPNRENIEPHYISAAYGSNAFSWDTSTMLLFARYAWKTRPTIVAMNNFYRNPNLGRDGKSWSIPHEIIGLKRPSGTPPQIMAWAEWEHYLMTGDTERLRYAVPFLLKNYQTFREKGGADLAYPRIGKGIELSLPSRGQSMNGLRTPLGNEQKIAIETVAQMAHSALCLARMSAAIGDQETAAAMQAEYQLHVKYLRERHWDAQRGYFLGLADNGDFFPFFQAGNFWPWLAEATTPEQDIAMLTALFDPTKYRQGNFVPTTSFENSRWFAPKDGRLDGPFFRMYATFWNGGSWPPTNQMVIRGLRNSGLPMFAREVAMDVLRWSIEQPLLDKEGPIAETNFKGINVYAEHFYPEFERKVNRRGETQFRLGQSGVKRGHFVGWSGGPVLNGIIEELIGILPDAPSQTITWRINELPRHGLTNIHLGPATIDLIAHERQSTADPVVVEVKTDEPFTLRVHLGTFIAEKQFAAGEHTWEVGTFVDPMAGLTMTPADFSAVSTDVDPRWNINGIRLGMTMDEVQKIAGEERWINKPMSLLDFHYADRMTVFLEEKPLTNVIFNAEGRVIMVWSPAAPNAESDERLKTLSEAFGDPVAEWRHPEYPAHQFLVWGEARTDAYGLLDNGDHQASLLMYNMGKRDASRGREGGMKLWDAVGIAKMREGLRTVISHAVAVSRPAGE